jgi:hypothetical protein
MHGGKPPALSKTRVNTNNRTRSHSAWFTLLCFSLGNMASMAEPVKIVLPAETASFLTNPGAEYAMGQCLQCHSAEYISTQPPLNRDAWKASIEKMRKKYGAMVPAETEGALLDYLVSTYGKNSASSPGK